MSVNSIRIFISSPGDVADERRRAALVIRRLKRDFARFFDIVPVLWEYEPMLARGTFQDVIVEPASTDIVVLILWSRLGTPLPPQGALREYRGLDGHAPVTGTEWEFENALAAMREHIARHEPAIPDILVYKKDVEGIARAKTSSAFSEAMRQMAALEQFWARYFQNPEGYFTLAFNMFTSLDGFERQLEANLRARLHARIEAENLAPIDWLGDPYLGLKSFEFEHANIFFGRSSAIQEVAETLIQRAGERDAFIMVAGASGCGKSSLVKAGVVPSLMEPGVVSDVQVWRHCTIQPSGDASLADRLTAALAAALPELSSLGLATDALGQELKAGDILSLRYGLVEAARRGQNPPSGAPGGAQVGENATGYESAPLGRLILIIDQFEELFTDPRITPDDRRWFIKLILKLAESGFVWVIATMRSDFFTQLADYPELHDRCAGNGLYHLLPPRSEEIDQMIRLPAEAAGLSFESDPVSRVALDQEIRADAAADPYSLPLLEFALDELYRRDVLERRGKILRIATYRDELQRLQGAIAARAETVCNNFSPAMREKALPQILRALVTIGDDNKPTARFVPQTSLTNTPDKKQIEQALREARLLVVHSQDQVPMIRVAHEALITAWPFYDDLVKKHAVFLRARARVAAQAKLWESQNKDSSRLLAAGLALEEGRSLLERRDELETLTAAFVDTSITAAEWLEWLKRVLLIGVAAAAVVIAAVFAGIAEYAHLASLRAQSNFEAATTALSSLIESVPKNVEPVAPLQTVTALMDEARSAIGKFPATDGDSAKIRRYRAEISLALGEIAFDLGQYREARQFAAEAMAALTMLAADRADLDAQFNLARGQRLFGATYYQLQDDATAARDAYTQAVAILESLLRDHGAAADAWLWQLALATVHQDFGDLYLDRIRDPAAAKAEFDQAIGERLDVSSTGRGGPVVSHDVAWTINKLGDVRLRTGDKPDATTDFESARDQIKALGQHLQENKNWQNHLSAIYNNIGLLLREDGHYQDALDQFAPAIDLAAGLTNRDPDNTDVRSVLGWSYDNDGETLLRWAKAQPELRRQHLDQARNVLGKALAVRNTLAALKPQWRQDLTYTQASLRAADGVDREMDNDELGAGEAYAEAADLNQQVAAASQRDDAVERTITFDEWAAAAYVDAGVPGKARERLTQAIDAAKSHHSMAGDSAMTDAMKRLEAELAAVK